MVYFRQFIFKAASALFVLVGAVSQVQAADAMVRVAIIREAREVDLEIEGHFILRDAQTSKIVLEKPRQPITTLRLIDKGFLMGANALPYKRLLIEPLEGAPIKINRRSFRGEVLLVRTKNNRINAINSINIEDYIKGVLYHEVSHHWPMEAIKAQAVASRTYALYAMAQSAKKDFDVTNDIYSQVYGGKNSERYRTGLAVDRTAGEILMFNDKTLPSYFHATCAGMTEDAQEMWDMNIAPLKGVPCQFCQDSPHLKWKKNFRLSDIQGKLNQRGFKIGPILDIAVQGRNRSGRIQNLKITGRGGDELIISGKDFREVVGPNALKSNLYDVEMKGYFVDFIGKGWGHGVGMCQWGARGMALQQFNYRQILGYYYPGAQIVDYHGKR